MALSLLCLGNLVESGQRFLSLASPQTTDDKSVRLALHASSEMARMCLCKQSFTEAEDWCKKTRVEWRHLVGKQYQIYITSVRLIAFAYELKGDVADAAAFNDIADEAQVGVDPGSEENVSLGFTAEQSRNQVTQYHQAAPDTKEAHNLSEKSLADPGLDLPVEGSIAEQFYDQNYPKDPRPALLQAAQNGDTAAVEHFLQNGAGINAKDSEGWTALHKAAQGVLTAIIEYLLLNGANIEAKTDTGCTALYLAVNEGHATGIKALLKHNVRIESNNNN